MGNKFIAEPPKQSWQNTRWLSCWGKLPNFVQLYLYAVIPFQAMPVGPVDPPEWTSDPDDKQLAQCQSMFDDVEKTRDALEQKAWSTFGFVTFFFPLVSAALVFLLGGPSHKPTVRILGITFSIAAIVFLTFGFIAILRAVTVKTRQVLFLGSVIDFATDAYRAYDKKFHARGLMYCASFNAAMNAHIAQFVKTAHWLTAASVFSILIAAIPAGLTFMKEAPAVAKTEIVGTVALTSTEFAAIRDSIDKLSNKTEADRVVTETLLRINDRLMKVEAQAPSQGKRTSGDSKNKTSHQDRTRAK